MANFGYAKSVESEHHPAAERGGKKENERNIHELLGVVTDMGIVALLLRLGGIAFNA